MRYSCFFLFYALMLSTSLSGQSKSSKPATTPVVVVPVATALPNELLSGLQYRNAGPTRGGRATAIAGVPQHPFTFYFGGSGSGVWRSNDAGISWENISDGQIPCGSIGAIAVAPSDPAVLYVGTGSACPRGNISAGVGMYKSSDAGKTWQAAGLPKSGMIGKIAIHPSNPDQVYAAVLGNPFGPNKERGVYHSKDGGKTWEQSLAVNDSTGCVDLSMDPANPRIIYAAMWRVERKPWTLFDGNDKGGLWKTTDGGTTWTKLTGGLPTGLLGRIGVSVSPVNSNRIYAMIIAAEEDAAGMYRSDDAGANWIRICRDHRIRQRGWYYTHVTADPKDENTVYLCNVDALKSIDGGKTFDIDLNPPHGDTHGVWVNPDNPNILINCNDGGACVSLNGGKTWTTQLNQPTSEFYRVTVDNQFPYRLYAGQQDNSTISIPSHDPGGLTPTENWFQVGGSESADVAVNGADPNLIWSTAYSGEITLLNRRTGQVRQVTAYPHFTEGTEMRDLKYRFQWNPPVLVSKFNPNVVYYASNYVHRTSDSGQNWQIVSPDLTRKIDAYLVMPGGPIQHDATGVEVYCSIFSLEESPSQAGELWAGTDDGRIHYTKDEGKTWTEITPKNIPKECTINKIKLSTHAAGRAFVAVQNYRNNDFKPYILRTTDYGKTWSLLTDGKNGIPNGHFVRAVAEDPDRQGLLYAGTEYGLYVSFDDGLNWQALQLNLPVVPITDLEVWQKDLVISTQGRGFWILDDLTPLHALNRSIAAAPLQLIKPRAAYRTDIDGYAAKFNCFLAEAPAKEMPLKMEILDARGAIVRTFSKDTSNFRNRLSLKKGWNTLTWDLHHDGPQTAENLVLMEMGVPIQGPWAIPGKYQVRLKMGKETQTQDIEVLPDPRWTDVTPDDYQAQLTMALEISQMITASQLMVKNIRSLRQQMQNTAQLAVQSGQNKKLETLATELGKQLTAVEESIVQNKAEAGQDNFNYPRRFVNHLARLYSVVIWDHERPTGGAIEAYEDLKKVFAGINTRYGVVRDSAVQQFNQLLESEKVPRLLIPFNK
jgi:photosystem II stability/assembly factor-like uncharacterized protein